MSSCTFTHISAEKALPPIRAVTEGNPKVSQGRISGGRVKKTYRHDVRNSKTISEVVSEHDSGISPYQLSLQLGGRWSTLQKVLMRGCGIRWRIVKNPKHRGWIVLPRQKNNLRLVRSDTQVGSK